MSFHEALRDLLFRHGKPTSEDAAWHTMIHVQVLQMELLEKIMASIQNLADSVVAEGAALDDLKGAVATFLTNVATPPAPTGTVLTSGDQAALDSANAAVQGNLQKVAEIKALLGATAAPAPAPAPAVDPAPAPAA